MTQTADAVFSYDWLTLNVSPGVSIKWGWIAQVLGGIRPPLKGEQ